MLHGFQATPEFARAGSLVELTFWSSEELPALSGPAANPAARFADVPMECVAAGFSHRCAVVARPGMGAGPRSFTASAVDATGNSTGSITPPVEVVLDFEPPVLSVRATRERVVRGEPIAFVVEADEPLGELPALEAPFIDGQAPCSGPVPGTRFDCGAVVPAAGPVGPSSFVAAGVDRAGNTGVSPPGTVSLHTAPVVTIARIGPSFVGEGGVISIGVSADQPLERCGATVAGRLAPCSLPAGSTCACSFEVERGALDGTADVWVEGENAYGAGTAVGAVAIDMSPPVVDGALVSITRNAFGTEDGILSLPGGVIDLGASYPGRGVRTVRVWDSPDGGAELLGATPRADGSFDELALRGTADTAPGRLWASAVDAAGNEGDRIELSGGDVEAPTIDREGLTLRHFPAGEPDSVFGAQGAIQDGPAGQRPWLQFFDAPVGGNAYGAPFLGDRAGGFEERALGVSGVPTVWVEARDKAGNVSRVQVGRVRQPHHLATWSSPEPPDGAAVLVPFTSDLDPRVVPPALGANGFGDPSAADSAAASAVDEARAELSAAAVRQEGAGWTFVSEVPAPRAGHAMAYDADRGVAVMFGGSAGQADLWELDGSGWTRRLTRVVPPTRSAHAMAYDAARRRVVLFGGVGETGVLADTWEYDGLEWTEVTPASGPSARAGHSATYDPIRERVVLYGGYDFRGLNDTTTWEYDGSSWSRATPLASPDARSSHAAAFDAGRGRLVLFGGRGAGDGTWEYDGLTWTLVQTLVAPGARYGHAMAYNPVRERIVLVGGVDPTGAEHAESWEYDGMNWTESTAPGPTHPVDAAMVWDSRRATLVLHGGLSLGTVSWSSETWERGPGDWTLTIPDSPFPSIFRAPTVYDEAQRAIVLFGGGQSEQETWTYVPGTWMAAAPASSPPRLFGPEMAYDAARGRTVLFGGGSGNDRPDATWEYDGTTWALQAPGAAPPGRTDHCMAYDAARGRVVLFGGSGAGVGNPRLQDTWEYDGAGWSQATPATLPPARAGASLAYDGARRRLVLFGGVGAPGELSDTWEYDGSDWALIPTPTSPLARSGAGMTYDVAHSRIVLSGGWVPFEDPLGDTWEYDGEDWIQMDTPFSPGSHSPRMTTDSARGRSVVFGGPTNPGGSEVWEYVSLASHRRTPAHAALFPIDRSLDVVALDATYVGSARGEFRRASTSGVRLLAWNAVQSRWDWTGGHPSDEAAPLRARTISAPLPGRASEYVAAEGVWLLAVPVHASSEYAGHTPSELATDYVELDVTHRIP